MPGADKNGNVQSSLVQQFSNVSVQSTHKELVKNVNLLLFCLPHPDMPGTLVQKTRGGGEAPRLCILICTLCGLNLWSLTALRGTQIPVRVTLGQTGYGIPTHNSPQSCSIFISLGPSENLMRAHFLFLSLPHHSLLSISNTNV